MELVVRTEAAADTQAAGAALATLLRPRDVVVLTGDLGAGKTTFTRGIAEGLGAEEHVQSPTFTLVREYLTGRLPVAHVDVYRLARIQDVVDLADGRCRECFKASEITCRSGMKPGIRKRQRKPAREQLVEALAQR